MPSSFPLDRRALIGLGALVVAVASVIALPWLLGDRASNVLAGLEAASARWLWIGAGAFLALIVTAGCAWRAGLQALGGKLSVVDASARYAAGSLVNSLAPAGSGGLVRIGLFSRTLPEGERILQSTGVATAIGIARAPSLAVLVVIAATMVSFPLWPVLVLAGATVGAALFAVWARGWTPHRHVAHVLDVFRALGRCPRAAAALVGWISLSTTAKVAGAAAVASALGVSSPLQAAVVMVPALALAQAVPLTPGAVGVGGGAIAISLSLLGVEGSTAIATGIAFQAVEATTGILAGATAMVWLSRPTWPTWSVRLAGSGACLALAAAFGVTVLV